MQIDTHNRNFSINDQVGLQVNNNIQYKCNFVFERGQHLQEVVILFQPSFLPNMVMNNMTNLKSGLSPLIECPCSDRITKSTVKTSSIITTGKCIIFRVPEILFSGSRNQPKNGLKASRTRL